MPIDPADLLVSQITADDIKEFIDPVRSPRHDSLAVGSDDLTMYYKIPGDKLKAAAQFLLGVDYCDTNLNLRRSLPSFHPVWTFAYAKTIDIEGRVYDKDDTDAVLFDNQITPAAWKLYEVKVVHSVPPFPVLADDDVTAEYQRFTTKFITPDTQIVSVDNGLVTYDIPVVGAFPWAKMPHNATIPIARRQGCGVKVVWSRVPEDYLLKGPDDLPQKFMDAKGKVNANPLFGCPAETLQLMDVKMDEKFICPLLTDQLGKPSFLYRIEFHFAYFKQLDSQIGLQGPPIDPRRGWNVLLGPRMLYWPATNALSGKKIFEPVDMSKLWTNYTDPIT